VTNALNGPVNIYSNFTFAGSKDLNLGASPVTLFRSAVVTNLAKTLTWAGSVGDGGSNYALTVAGAGSLAITGNLGIGGKVTVTGSGTLILSGANSFTGTAAVSSGTLIVAHSGALGSTNGLSEVSGPNSIQLLNGVTIADETLSLGGQGPDNKGALQAAAGASAWNGPIRLNENNAAGWTPRLGYKGPAVLTVGGPVKSGVGTHLWISGDQGDGRVILASTNNTYTGITGIIRGTLALGAHDALPTVTKLDMHPASAALEYSRFDLNGFNQTVAALYQTTSTSVRIVTNSSETASVLTVNPSADAEYSGLIAGNLSLVKGGPGTLTLSGANNTYSGATVLAGGTLALGADGALSAGSPVTLAGGTLSVGAHTQEAGPLTVSGDAAVALGEGAGRLAFADSSAQSWSGTLDLTGALAPGSVRFGTSASALTLEQLGRISVNGQRLWLALDGSGYLYVRKGTVFCAW
jgi:autotransporter-associated beta strand protein